MRVFTKLALLGVLAFAVPCGSKAANVNIVNQCSVWRTSASNGTTNVCDIQNTTSGNKIVIATHAFGTSFSLSCTEACTCPAGAISGASSGHFTQICFADTSSGHADFAITTTLTCSSCGAVDSMMAFEVSGLGSSFDTAAAAVAKTVNFTTANATEWAFQAGYDFSGALAPASSFSLLGEVTSANSNMNALTQLDRLMGASLLTGVAGSYTASYTNTSSFPANNVAVIAFTTSGGVTPTPVVIQQCGVVLASGTNPVTETCRLYNTVAGNTIIAGWFTNGGIQDNTSTETINYPANAQNRPNGVGVSEGIGYVITSSSHATFDVAIATNGGNAIGLLYAIEVSGLVALDTGASAHSASTSANFTTAANNEQAFFVSLDDANNLMVPGNSFLPIVYGVNHSNQSGLLFGSRTIATAGSYTASYTQTGSTMPNTGVLAFTVPAIVTPTQPWFGPLNTIFPRLLAAK